VQKAVRIIKTATFALELSLLKEPLFFDVK
jgi:hypothetical protein